MNDKPTACDQDFFVSCWYGCGDILHITAASDLHKNPQFAFYVFVDGKKVATSWYGSGRDVKIKLPEVNSKNIKITAFCKFDGGKLRKTLSPSYLFGSIDGGYAVVVAFSSSALGGEGFRIFDEVGSIIKMESAEAVGDLWGYIKKTGAKIPRGHNVKYFRSSVVLPSCRKLTMTYRDFPDAIIPWANDRLSLEFLYTPTEELFKNRFTFAATRHYSSEVIFEISKNNLADPSLPDNIYINSSVVYLYKSLELDIFNLQFELLDEVSRRAMRLVERVRQGGSVRADKVQLALSVLVARIHFLFLRRQYEDVMACSILASKLVNDYGFRDSYSLNLSKANFFALVAAYIVKDRHAYFRFMQCVLETRFFLDDFLHSNNTEWLVAESKYVYALADLAIALKGEPPEAIDLILAGLREASRVKTDDYLSAIEDLVRENE